MSDIERLTVDLQDRSYDILVGPGLVAQAGAHIAPLLREPRCFVVTDENVAGQYLGPLTESLTAAGLRVEAFVIPAGEASKSFDQFQRLMNDMLSRRASRGLAVVALGGGVVGDLAGFAAASLLRGVDFIQIPTTLLSQVDSSVGGKTGINSPYGKNLVGAFYQPRIVLADTATLDTLPERELLAGYAEVVKYGLIDRPAFFDWLCDNGPPLIAGDAAARRHAIVESCRAKAETVAADERESGRRALLNLGHTFGHALEAEAGYNGSLLHGEAVAIGMRLAFDLSARLGLCPPTDAARVRDHLLQVGLPADIPGQILQTGLADRLMDHMSRDKKVDNGRLTLILARAIGQSFVTNDVEPGAIRALWDHDLAA
ncbi:MAG: 3-dehydroquinate synthase [Rhodospirillales bacterium]